MNKFYQQQRESLRVLFSGKSATLSQEQMDDFDFQFGFEGYDDTLIDHAVNAKPTGTGEVVTIDPVEDLETVEVPEAQEMSVEEPVNLGEASSVLEEAVVSLEQQRSTFAELYGAWDRLTNDKAIDRHFAQRVEDISPGILTNLTHLNSFTQVRSKTNYELAKRVLESEVNNVSGQLGYRRLATLHAIVGIARGAVEKGAYFNTEKMVDPEWHARFRSTVGDIVSTIKTIDPTLNPISNNIQSMDEAEIAIRKFIELTA